MPKGLKFYNKGSFTRNGICPCCDKTYRGEPTMVSKLIKLHIKTAHKDFDMNRITNYQSNKHIPTRDEFLELYGDDRFGRDFKNKERQEIVEKIRLELKMKTEKKNM